MSYGAVTCDDERWEQLWEHRDALLRVARNRLPCAGDAEDAVSETLLRAAVNGQVRWDTAGAWMTRVVVNLCNDRHREASYERSRVRYVMRHTIPVASPEDDVCDRLTAAGMVRHVLALPARQREAILLRAAGNDVATIARRIGCDYKAVESLLSRARRSLRTM